MYEVIYLRKTAGNIGHDNSAMLCACQNTTCRNKLSYPCLHQNDAIRKVDNVRLSRRMRRLSSVWVLLVLKGVVHVDPPALGWTNYGKRWLLNVSGARATNFFLECLVERLGAWDNLFEWHFTIRGPEDTEFSGGVYHGRILLPSEYPMKPPNIVLLTPNGRFETHRKICLSISGYHPESWRPSWSIRTALLAIIGFMPTHGAGAIGSLDLPAEERKALARTSQSFVCDSCGPTSNLLRPLTDASRSVCLEAAEAASQIAITGTRDGQKPTENPEEPALKEDGDKKPDTTQSVSAIPSNSVPETSGINSVISTIPSSVCCAICAYKSRRCLIHVISRAANCVNMPRNLNLRDRSFSYVDMDSRTKDTESLSLSSVGLHLRVVINRSRSLPTSTLIGHWGLQLESSFYEIIGDVFLKRFPVIYAKSEDDNFRNHVLPVLRLFSDFYLQKRAFGSPSDPTSCLSTASAPLTPAVVTNSATCLSHRASASFTVHRDSAHQHPATSVLSTSTPAAEAGAIFDLHSNETATSESSKDTVIEARQNDQAVGAIKEVIHETAPDREELGSKLLDNTQDIKSNLEPPSPTSLNLLRESVIAKGETNTLPGELMRTHASDLEPSNDFVHSKEDPIKVSEGAATDRTQPPVQDLFASGSYHTAQIDPEECSSALSRRRTSDVCVVTPSSRPVSAEPRSATSPIPSSRVESTAVNVHYRAATVCAAACYKSKSNFTERVLADVVNVDTDIMGRATFFLLYIREWTYSLPRFEQCFSERQSVYLQPTGHRFLREHVGQTIEALVLEGIPQENLNNRYLSVQTFESGAR
ncbi:ubiquitin-conjugating enzyme E2 J1, partial [Clonorchis sinensis]